MWIAVTGASGWVGSAIVSALQARGHQVRALNRRAVGQYKLDLEEPRWRELWPAALSGCAALVHCAAHVHKPNESLEERTRFTAVNELGTQRLMLAAKMAHVTRCVLVSTIAVYDMAGAGMPMTEGAALRPASAYGQSKITAERAVRDAGLDWRIGRLSTVFGIGDRANFARLADGLRRGRFIIPGDGSARKSVISVERAGEVFARLATTDGLDGRVFNVAAPSAPSLLEICSAFSRACGFSPPVRVPLPIVRCGAIIGDLLRRFDCPFPVTSDTVRKLTSNTVVDVSALRSTFPDIQWGDFHEELVPAATYYGNISGKRR